MSGTVLGAGTSVGEAVDEAVGVTSIVAVTIAVSVDTGSLTAVGDIGRLAALLDGTQPQMVIIRNESKS